MNIHLVPTRIRVLFDKLSKSNPELFVPNPEEEQREIQRNKEALVPDHLKALRRLRSAEEQGKVTPHDLGRY